MMTDYTDLLARGIPVYSLEGQYDWWGMVNVQTDETAYEGSGFWVKAEDAAAAIAALTAERDALRDAAQALRDDMLERSRIGIDAIHGDEYRIVNAGRTAWYNFCAALTPKG